MRFIWLRRKQSLNSQLNKTQESRGQVFDSSEESKTCPLDSFVDLCV